jgi:hypothetical protein
MFTYRATVRCASALEKLGFAVTVSPGGSLLERPTACVPARKESWQARNQSGGEALAVGCMRPLSGYEGANSAVSLCRRGDDDLLKAILRSNGQYSVAVIICCWTCSPTQAFIHPAPDKQRQLSHAPSI